MPPGLDPRERRCYGHQQRMSIREPRSSTSRRTRDSSDPADREGGDARPGFSERSADMLAQISLPRPSEVRVLLTPTGGREERDVEAMSRKIRELEERITDFETLLRVIPTGISIARDPECKVIVS